MQKKKIMGTYRFRQAYFYGDDWDGSLINIPDSAVFYKMSVLSETQEEWYIMISKKDIILNDEDDDITDILFGKGCAQVGEYEFFDYYIIHLNNIKPYGDWNDVGKNEFNSKFKDYFESCYVYEYIPEKYELIDDNTLDFKFNKISEKKLCSVYRLKGIASDASYIVTKIDLLLPIVNTEMYCISENTLGMHLLEKDCYDPLHLKRVVTHDDSIYRENFNLVINKLY